MLRAQGKIFDKRQGLENSFIYIFQILFSKVIWQILQQCILLLEVKLVLHEERFLNIVIYFAFQLPFDTIVFRHLLESLDIECPFSALLPDIADEVAHTVDIVSQTNARDHLDEGQT